MDLVHQVFTAHPLEGRIQLLVALLAGLLLGFFGVVLSPQRSNLCTEPSSNLDECRVCLFDTVALGDAVHQGWQRQLFLAHLTRHGENAFRVLVPSPLALPYTLVSTN